MHCCSKLVPADDHIHVHVLTQQTHGGRALMPFTCAVFTDSSNSDGRLRDQNLYSCQELVRLPYALYNLSRGLLSCTPPQSSILDTFRQDLRRDVIGKQ
jgi:hypothetical protein